MIVVAETAKADWVCPEPTCPYFGRPHPDSFACGDDGCDGYPNCLCGEIDLHGQYQNLSAADKK